MTWCRWFAAASRFRIARTRQIDADVAVLRTRRLDHQPFVYVWLDATYVHVRENRQVVSKAIVIATGLRADGHREVLGLDVGDSENEPFWKEFLGSLVDRGLAGVRLVTSDAHAGAAGKASSLGWSVRSATLAAVLRGSRQGAIRAMEPSAMGVCGRAKPPCPAVSKGECVADSQRTPTSR